MEGTAWTCGSDPSPAVTTLETTFLGQEDREYVTTELAPAETSTSSSPVKSSSASQVPGSSGGEDQDTSNGDEENSSSEDDGPPIGAIVGGCIGGVLLLATVGMGIFFMLKRKKNKAAPTPPDYSAVDTAGSPGHMAGGDSYMQDGAPHGIQQMQQGQYQYQYPQQGWYPTGQTSGHEAPKHTNEIYEADGNSDAVHEMPSESVTRT